MSLGDVRCACGRTRRVDALALTLTVCCPGCGAEERLERAYDVAGGDPLPDLGRLRAGDPVSSAETMQLPDPTPAGPLEATSDLAAIAVTPPSGVGPARGPDGEEIPHLPVGTELGCFRIERTLGQGGMGVVYKAYDSSLDRFVALKVLSPTLSRNRTFIERFRREAVACGKLSHPNITHIYSISSKDEPLHYFAMEYVEGENLAERVQREGPFPPERVLDVARQTALGLKEAAAAAIIHRDIKPSNLLLTASGQVKITDFGLAKARASLGQTLDLTSTGVVMGTPLYMSPEQGRGGRIDHRSDIYSLGGTLFFLTFGCPPFEADSAIALILKHINDIVVFPEREVGEGIKGLLLRMLEKDQSRRPHDYDELLEDIERARRGELQSGGSPTRVIVLPKRSRSTGKVGPRGTGSLGGLKASKLSVARTNIKLGRRDRAVSLLLETVQEGDPALRAEAALLLMQLYEQEEDAAGVRRMAETIVSEAAEPAATAYAAWKLAALDERAALDKTRAALARYEAILADPPEGLPREVIEEQVRRLKARVAEVEREAGATQVVLGSSDRER